MIALFIAYFGIGAIFAALLGSTDGANPFKAEVGIGAGMLVGVLWPFALIYVAGYVSSSGNRLPGRRTPTGGRNE